jgi:hypothetical protein
MKLEEIEKKLNTSLNYQLISTNVLLGKLRLIDEDSRKSGQYQDPLYFPFYYHLSKFIKPTNVLQVGLYLGLPLCCFLQGEKSSIENVLCFQKKQEDFYSEKLALSNIKDLIKNTNIKIDYYYGEFLDKEFEKKILKFNWDLILVNQEVQGQDEISNILDFCWQIASLDSFVVVDRINSNKLIKDSFVNFCKINNREKIIFNTRYGTGIFQK